MKKYRVLDGHDRHLASFKLCVSSERRGNFGAVTGSVTNNSTMHIPMKTLITSSLLATGLLGCAHAQEHHHQHAHQHHAAQHGPYAGMQNREIKALSAQQIQGYREGRGMAMAMPAELNGYPGPLHVLEHAAKLGLTAEQVALTQKLYAEMQATAKTQGEKLIAAERELDGLFAQKRATADNVASAVSAAAVAQGHLRETHLRYHLAMMNVLTPEQIATYNQLRGY